MAEAVRLRILIVVGLGAVVTGSLVLRSRNAAGVGVDPLADPPRAWDWLDTLCAWNGTREVGAVLVVLGLTALAAAVGVLIGTRCRVTPSRRVLIFGAIVVVVLLVGGITVFAYPRELEVTYEGTYRLLRAPAVMPPMVLATMVWTRSQAVAALVTAIGVLLAGGVAGVAVGVLKRVYSTTT